jgi:malate dehydrogenase (oxaloacetate-decarboxylating)(NADP+)
VSLADGQAALGIARLMVSAMMEEGTSRIDAISKIWLVDSQGLIVKVLQARFSCG